MIVKNWLGQFIGPGAWVYRGARNGNSSEFKVGIVTKVNLDKRKATVSWRYEPSRYWTQIGPTASARATVEVVWPMDSTGTCDANSLVLVDERVIQRLEVAASFARQAARDNWSQEQYDTTVLRTLVD